MILLWIGLGFALGLIVAALLAAIAIRRREEALRKDPWVTPPTPEAARLLKASHMHLYRHILGRPAEDPGAPDEAFFNGAEALQALYLSDGVIFFEKRIATLPDGRQIELGAVAHEVLDVLRETYIALDAASALITDYATSVNTAEELSKHPNDILRRIAGHGAMYPMQGVIVRLAKLLQLDPDKNEVGIGGEALWERIRRWRRPDRDYSAGSGPIPSSQTVTLAAKCAQLQFSDQAFLRAINEIEADIERGVLPAWIGDYDDLELLVPSPGAYGGLWDKEVETEGAELFPSAEGAGYLVGYADACSDIRLRIHLWLRGRPGAISFGRIKNEGEDDSLLEKFRIEREKAAAEQ